MRNVRRFIRASSSCAYAGGMVQESIEMNTDAAIPSVGLGTWDLAGVAEEPVLWALEAGYRHIDTATIYETEAEIGRAITKSGVPREEIFITTKLWREYVGLEAAARELDKSLDRLGTDYVDLYLIHWPNADPQDGPDIREATWEGMEAVFNDGKAKAIGVSNYEKSHLVEMETYANIPPAVNQIEMHPLKIPDDTIAYCHEHGIVVVDYAPLARTQLFSDTTLNGIAKKHKKSAAQVMLRWGLQHGHVVIPKSHLKQHIEENIAVFDFELSAEEMQKLDALDKDESVTQ